MTKLKQPTTLDMPKFRRIFRVQFIGRAPPEIWERWAICEDLAEQFCQKSLDNKAGKRAHMSEVAILDQYHLERLLKTGGGTDAEMCWVVRRVAQLVNWDAPASAR